METKDLHEPANQTDALLMQMTQSGATHKADKDKKDCGPLRSGDFISPRNSTVSTSVELDHRFAFRKSVGIF